MVFARGILLCQTFQIFLGGQPYALSLLPRGTCVLCCSINLEEDIIFMSHHRIGAPLRCGVRTGAPGVDPGKPTVVYIHGFTEQSTGESASTVRDAYFSAGEDVNFLTMDWGRLCAFPWYSNAAANAEVAGRYLSLFLDRLALDGVPLGSVHLIGFSLGAVVAGFAGRSAKMGQIGRITGLDPAYPRLGPESQLSHSDASFVDVIHTDGGEIGVPYRVGHADFFPNGGKPLQPGCSATDTLLNGIFPGQFVACSHHRAWRLYAESVTDPTGFPAVTCRSVDNLRTGRCLSELPNNKTVAYMGIAAPHWCRGMFFLETKAAAPFAMRTSPLNYALKNKNDVDNFDSFEWVD